MYHRLGHDPAESTRAHAISDQVCVAGGSAFDRQGGSRQTRRQQLFASGLRTMPFPAGVSRRASWQAVRSFPPYSVVSKSGDKKVLGTRMDGCTVVALLTVFWVRPSLRRFAAKSQRIAAFAGRMP